MFDAIVFAGGGNRCYWQQGFWEAAAPRLELRPRRVVGASAGAFQAAVALLGIGSEVRKIVIEGTLTEKPPNFDLKALMRGKHAFPVAGAYRGLMEAVFTEVRRDNLEAMTDFQIAIAHPPEKLPTSVSIALGLAAYQIEKKLKAPVHPTSGRALGFQPAFISLKELATPADFIATLMASAGVPPIMPLTRINGRYAVDGGLVDNVPVAPVLDVEAAGGKTLVLLTRLYRSVPEVPGRTYVQPSQKIGIGQFELTNLQGYLDAHALGLKDGAAFAESLGR
jgi:predicted patatin/cPLA2 family phospholipase